ncbi:hypothetical protein [Fulvivirga sediminis]|uniref:Outer membrane protein beta-barrel domain-containing protein n=1 Tax=Fulvivirga sediminis TaxID=2803949 RepID=A0A937K1J9_9BACT|nr:hypothetical protein [Fulvivirga sediminis]MBL3657415.1 hypothetical protein [Fulvivirga sediminis]
MDKQNRSNFDDQWQQAFEDAELEVSNHVWERIELDLANANNSKMKRRLLFFQLLAAASVVFALTISGIYSYQWYSDKNAGIPKGENSMALNSTEVEGSLVLDKNNTNNSGISPDAENSYGDSGNLINNGFQPERQGSGLAHEISRDDVNSEERGSVDENVNSEDVKEAISNKHLLVDNDRDFSAAVIHKPTDNNHKERSLEDKVEGRDRFNKTADDLVNDDLQQGSSSVAQSKQEGHNLEDEIVDIESEKRTVAINKDNNQNNIDIEEPSASTRVVLISSQDEGLPKDLDRRFDYLMVDSLMNREMEMVPWYAYVPSKSKETGSKDTWAGVGFAAGKFDPNIGGGANASMANMDFEGNSLAMRRSPTFSEESSGQSVNVGVSVGTQLAKRWVVQGGLSYLQQQASSASNVVSNTNNTTTGRKSAKTVTSFNSIGNNGSNNDQVNIEFTRPYEIVNTYQLVSVPVQAGYIVLDKKFNITLLSGVANNILIKNTFDGSDGNVEDLTVSAGSDSPYRTYQISGLLGSEFSYEMGEHYILSLLPQLRQALTSVTKSDSDFDSRPTILEVGFRFKYIF